MILLQVLVREADGNRAAMWGEWSQEHLVSKNLTGFERVVDASPALD
jgi:hypothetical protein